MELWATRIPHSDSQGFFIPFRGVSLGSVSFKNKSAISRKSETF